MYKSQTLKALVSERLTAAAEEIFALFEKTIAEYEQELSRSEDENQRKQRRLDSILSPKNSILSPKNSILCPKTAGVGVGVQTPSARPGPGLNQRITETPRVKEEPQEQGVKPEEELQPEPFQEFSSVCVKSEDPENQEGTEGENISSEQHFHSETEGDHKHFSDTDDNWESLFSCAATEMKTEVDGDHYIQDQSRDRSSAEQNPHISLHNKSVPETSATGNNEDTSDFNKGAFECQGIPHPHRRTLTDEKTFSCALCNKTFTKQRNLKEHISTHTQEKPFSCLICNKTFRYSANVSRHKKIHTGEKPYSCSVCNKRFALMSYLKIHMKTHTAEAPYSCTFCNKAFAQKCKLVLHTRIHTGEKPFSCSVCQRGFADKARLKRHKDTCK